VMRLVITYAVSSFSFVSSAEYERFGRCEN
jgi:hypothetical protein